MSQQKNTLPWLGKFLLWLSLDYEDYYQAAGVFIEFYLLERSYD